MGLSPKEMEEAIIKNLPEKTGKSLTEWLHILSKESLLTNKEMKAFLKEKHQLGYFQAQTIVKKHFEKSIEN